MALQSEQRSLLSALDAVESALLEAREASEQQSALRQRLEAALEGKGQAVADLKRELKEARREAEQVCVRDVCARKLGTVWRQFEVGMGH
jgi:chromosome segregation ATPase